jgi:excisionase family DNA binding protein
MADFLTIKEVCDILRIGERTAYELCRTSQLGGAVRVGGQWRIERTAFEAWAKRGGGPAEAEQQDDDDDGAEA